MDTTNQNLIWRSGTQNTAGLSGLAQPSPSQTQVQAVSGEQLLAFQREIFNQVVSYNIQYLTIAILLLLGISWFSLNSIRRRMAKQGKDLRILKDETRVQLQRAQSLFEKKQKDINKLQRRINNLSNSTNAELARVLAIGANKDGSFETAFSWWIEAAYYNTKIGHPIAEDQLKFAEQNLSRVSKDNEHSIEELKDNLQRLDDRLEKLSTTFKIVTDRIKMELTNKIN